MHVLIASQSISMCFDTYIYEIHKVQNSKEKNYNDHV